MDANEAGQVIRKKATAYDGYDGGLRVERDCTGVEGGDRGMVSVGAFFKTVTAKLQKGFEWNLLALLENHAEDGENCAFYSQANKKSTGPTWGGCVELCDTEGLAGRGVGLEVDHWTTGPSREADAPRFGVDILLGDAKTKREQVSTGVAEGDFGIRVDVAAETPWARWRFGALFQNFTECGLKLSSVATRGIAFYGKYTVAIDASGTECQTVLRMDEGQQITFDVYDATRMRKKGGFFEFLHGEKVLMRLDVNTGAAYFSGDLHIGGKLIQKA